MNYNFILKIFLTQKYLFRLVNETIYEPSFSGYDPKHRKIKILIMGKFCCFQTLLILLTAIFQ